MAQAIRKGRSTHIDLGPGRYEDLKVRIWLDARPQAKGEGRLVIEVKGTFRIYCGYGGEHTAEVNERDVSWQRYGDQYEAARQGDLIAAENIVAEMVEWAIDEWADPCDGWEEAAA